VPISQSGRAATEWNEPRRSPFRSFAIPLALLALAAAPAGAADLVFSAIGDVPYAPEEIAELEQHVADHNRYSPSAFLVHLGDIQSGSEPCQELRYQTVADLLATSEVPVFIVPGDNEWVGCADPAQGWAWWETHLLGLEQSFCGIWPVEAQATRPENFSFVRDGVLFLGLNYVSGTPSAVVQADAEWVNAQFAAHGASARAAVLMAQKEPGGALFDAVRANGRAFAKPVLYIHGDGHEWREDPLFFGEPNMLRVQVDRGTSSHPPVQVTVTEAGAFLFDRDPWPPGTPEVSRPPCGPPSLSIDDLFVTEGQNAVFTVTLSGGTGSSVSVGYATQDGSARAGEDYVAKSGSLSFSGTTTARQISVGGLQDAAVEPGEFFFVNLTNPSGAALAKPQGAAVVLDDDSPPPPSGGTPTLQEVVSGGSVSSSVVATSGPVGAASEALYLAAIAMKSNAAVTNVSGLGLAWTQVRHQCGGRAQTGIALFRAFGSPAAGGVVTANLAAPASAAVIHVARYSGASATSAIGAVASANTNGVSGACSGGIDTSAYQFGLTTGGANSLVFVAAAMRSKDHLPGSGWTEVAETYAGDAGSTAGASLAQRLVASAGAVSVNGSFSGTSDWAVVAAEVLAGSAPPASPVTLTVTPSTGGSVTLNPPGGSYSVGTTVTLTAVPNPGYAFSGWSGALTGAANPATLVMDTHKSVGASFSPAVQYTVTVQPTAGGSVSLSPSGGVYPSGTLVTVTAVPAAGYRFGSWGGALSGTSNPTTLLVDSNKTISANFVRQYSVTTSSTGSGSVVLSPAGGVYDAGTLVSATAVASNSVASFLGWGGDLAGTANPTTLLVDANKTVSASFTQTYTLSVSVRRKGSVVLDPPGGVYLAGTQVRLTAVPAAGYVFQGWSGALSGTTNPATLIMDGNRSVTATFRRL
jgi:uncharacterized repeat protein (TIGR02543 family)